MHLPDEKKLSPLETLPLDILMIILVFTGNPVYWGRFRQTSKKSLRDRLDAMDVKAKNNYWRPIYQRDCYALIDNIPDDCQASYREFSENRKQHCKLNDEYRKLLNLIRSGDLHSIRNGRGLPKNYEQLWESFIWERLNHTTHACSNYTDNAITLACRYGRAEILNYFYYEIIQPLLCVSNKFCSKHSPILCDSHGMTLLHWAAACGVINEVQKFLINFAADPENKTSLINQGDKNKQTALHFAASCGHTNIVKLLIENGAKTEIISKASRTPLQLACERRQSKVVEQLIAFKANIIFQKFLPLHLAAYRNDIKSVTALIIGGAEIDQTDVDYGYTALIKACLVNNYDIVDLLISLGANINKLDRGGASALIYACQNQATETVKLLLTKKVHLNVETYEGQTPLTCATAKNNLKIVAMLVAAGAPVNHQGVRNSTTPLIMACSRGYHDLVQFLLRHNARTDQVMNDGRTALICAGENGHEVVVQTLLTHNANINQVTLLGTALHLAAGCENMNFLQILLRCNANSQLRYQGLTALEVAAKNKKTKAYALLKLWQVKEQCRNKTLCTLIKELLLTSTTIPEPKADTHTFFGGRLVLKSTSKKSNGTYLENSKLNPIFKVLHEIENKNIPASHLLDYLKSQLDIIPVDKYKFIKDFILNNDQNTLRRERPTLKYA